MCRETIEAPISVLFLGLFDSSLLPMPVVSGGVLSSF